MRINRQKIYISTAILLTSSYSFGQNTDTTKYLEEVKVVTAQMQPQQVSKSVYKVNVIGQREIKLRNATNVLDLLNNQIGFRFSPDQTLGETDVNMFGMGGNNVKILVDGIPQIDRGSTKQSVAQIDVNSIERIEYIQGPVSVIYGTDAQAGVINIITKKKSTDGLSLSGSILEGTVGKNYDIIKDDGVHNANLNLGYKKGNWNFSVFGTRNNFGGWRGTYTGRQRQFLPKKQWFAGGGIGYKTDKTSIDYNLNYLHEDLYSPGVFINNTITYGYIDANYYTHRLTNNLQLKHKFNDKTNFTGSASYQNYTRKTTTIGRDLLKDSTWYTTDAGTQDKSIFKNAFFRGTLEYQANDYLMLQPGIDIKYDKGSGARIDGSPSITDYGFFVSAEWKPLHNDKLLLRPAVRFSKNSKYSAPPAIPSFNLKYNIDEQFSLLASYGMGFRAPTLRELYFYFHDSNHNIDGNTNLKAEHSNNFNLSVNYQKQLSDVSKFNASIGAFYNQFKNQINIAIDPDDVTSYKYFNIDKYRTVGFTWENHYTYKQLSVDLNAMYIGRYDSLSLNSTYGKLPTYTWSPEASANVMYTFAKYGTSVGVFYKYTGKLPIYQQSTSDETVATKAFTSAYSWMDANVAQPILKKRVTISAGVKNIFNITNIQNTASGTSAHSSASAIAYSYGRSYFVSLSFNLNKL